MLSRASTPRESSVRHCLLRVGGRGVVLCFVPESCLACPTTTAGTTSAEKAGTPAASQNLIPGPKKLAHNPRYRCSMRDRMASRNCSGAAGGAATELSGKALRRRLSEGSPSGAIPVPDVAWLYVPKGFSNRKTSREGRADESKAEKNAARGAPGAPKTKLERRFGSAPHPRLFINPGRHGRGPRVCGWALQPELPG